jgi:hypothetical protein
MTKQAEGLLQRGSALLFPLLQRHGFIFRVLDVGAGSGGHFASGEFRRGTRRLVFHVRHGLGMVTYHLADRAMTHQQYMHSVQGKIGVSHYPGFSNDALDAFEHLLLDLEEYGSDFLGGTDDCLLRRFDDTLALPSPRSGPPD